MEVVYEVLATVAKKNPTTGVLSQIHIKRKKNEIFAEVFFVARIPLNLEQPPAHHFMVRDSSVYLWGLVTFKEMEITKKKRSFLREMFEKRF